MSSSTRRRSPADRSQERYTLRVYDRVQLAEMLGASVAQVVTWSGAGMIPSPYGCGARAVWTAEDVATAKCGLALPGTYLVARHPMLRARIEAIREAGRAARAKRKKGGAR